MSYTQLSIICIGGEKRHGQFFHDDSKNQLYLALELD